MLKKFDKLVKDLISESTWQGGEAAFPEMIKNITLDEYPELTVKCSFDPEYGMTTVSIWKDKTLIGSTTGRNILSDEELEELAYKILANKKYGADSVEKQYSIEDLVKDIEQDPRYLIQWFPTYGYWRVKFAPGEFKKTYQRDKTNPGWALFNEFKKLWEANSDISYDRVNIGVYSLYVTLKP